ncbi:MAG: T9SS type A sorting domain-containing protein [Saprospiraceae bacterium]
MSEQNNAFFLIEKLVAKNWEVIGHVEGHRNTIEKQTYSFMDNLPSIGKNYYRLKQTDFDGTITYSQIVIADIQSILPQFEIAPNPAMTFIKVSGVDEMNEYITVLDVFGNVIYKNIKYDNIDNDTISINISFLESGVYVLKINNKTNIFVKQ